MLSSDCPPKVSRGAAAEPIVDVLQEERLELDRVLGPVRHLGAVERPPEPPLEPLDEGAVGLDRPERRLEGLLRADNVDAREEAAELARG